MKIGYIFFPLGIVIFLLGISIVTNANFLEDSNKDLIKTGAFIVFIIFVLLLTFQPYEK